MNIEAEDPQPTAMEGPAPGADAQALAAGFASWTVRWACARGAPPEAVARARVAATRLSLATSAGHVCLGIDELELPAPGTCDDAAAWRAALLASGVVGTPAQPGAWPMILDDGGRLYLHRYFDLERRLARSLRLRAEPTASDDGAVQRSGDDDALKALLALQFPRPADTVGRTPDGSIDWQQLATAAALTGRLTVISGGPGTGKTTMVVKLLACLLTQNPGCRIALAAPTGKAAARLLEALRERAAGLPAALRERLPGESYTLHRLLGLGAGGGRSGHAARTAAQPLLPCDALVVDEASMLDLALSTRLFEALAPQARLILLGDKDQLAAVEAGAVFAELNARRCFSAAGAERLAALCGLSAPTLLALDDAAPAAVDDPCTDAQAPAGLADQVVWFTRQHRFAADSGIGRLATAVQQGQASAALHLLREGHGHGVHWLDDGSDRTHADLSNATEQAMQDGYAGYLSDLHALADASAAGLDQCIAAAMAGFDRFRILCAVRDGPRGLAAVNLSMEHHLRLQTARWASASHQAFPALRPQAEGAEGGISSPWYVGRPLMIRRNDRVLGLFNGDIGLCLPDAQGRLQAWFADRAAASGRLRAIAPVRLPPHDSAFAITVHQSQGSEFDRVLVLLPGEAGRSVSRELLYTAVTRARQQVMLSGSAAVLARAIQTPTARRSGLWARWAEAGDPPATTG